MEKSSAPFSFGGDNLKRYFDKIKSSFFKLNNNIGSSIHQKHGLYLFSLQKFAIQFQIVTFEREWDRTLFQDST